MFASSTHRRTIRRLIPLGLLLATAVVFIVGGAGGAKTTAIAFDRSGGGAETVAGSRNSNAINAR